jgi:hypothetical protein
MSIINMTLIMVLVLLLGNQQDVDGTPLIIGWYGLRLCLWILLFMWICNFIALIKRLFP